MKKTNGISNGSMYGWGRFGRLQFFCKQRCTGWGQQHKYCSQFIRQAGYDGSDLVDRWKRNQGHARLD